MDIRRIPVADLRQRIGTMFQDHMTCDFTAAENIGIGDLPVLHDRERIHAAATAAEVHRTITELPHGYDTLLSRMFFMNSPTDGKSTGLTCPADSGSESPWPVAS